MRFLNDFIQESRTQSTLFLFYIFREHSNQKRSQCLVRMNIN